MAPRVKLLVVEDEPDILELLTYNLEREGYQVLTARDGEAGLAVAFRDSPALVLLDLMLEQLEFVAEGREFSSNSGHRHRIPLGSLRIGVARFFELLDRLLCARLELMRRGLMMFLMIFMIFMIFMFL